MDLRELIKGATAPLLQLLVGLFADIMNGDTEMPEEWNGHFPDEFMSEYNDILAEVSALSVTWGTDLSPEQKAPFVEQVHALLRKFDLMESV